QPHGACTIDENVVAQTTRQNIPSANGAGQRLDEGRFEDVGLRLELVDVASRGNEELLGGAIGRDNAQAVPEPAKVLVTVEAELALTARRTRVHRDVVADREVEDTTVDALAESDDRAGRFVAGDQREDC